MTQTIRKSLLALGAFLSLATPGLSQDSLVPPIPMSMVRIPGGTYQVGNVTGDPDLQYAPVRHVTLKEFHISKHLVTEYDWQRIRRWANANGYHDLKWGEGMGDLPLPMAGMMLKDAVLWANALSEYEGLQPVYRRKLEGSFRFPWADGSVYRSKYVEGWFSNPVTDWNANGYRLPRPDEWEVAARGGLVGRRFPWGNTITHSRANYVSTSANWWDVSPTRGHHPNWVVWQPSRNRRYPHGHPRRGDWQPWCSTVDFFPANGYGLHDMAGNAGQWCWEGAGSLCLRGGSVYLDGRSARCAARHDSDSGENLWYERNPGQVPALRLVRGGGL